MRYVVQRYYPRAGHARPAAMWREVAATNDEQFAKSLLQTFAMAILSRGQATAFRLVDTDTDSGTFETIATIGEADDD